MKSSNSNRLAASIAFLAGGAVTPLEAGRPAPEYEPLQGSLTLGLGFTADRIEGSANLLVPLYRDPNGNNMFFLDGNWDGKGDGNENVSAGVGFRHRFADPDIILGMNAFYDYGDYSGRGYHQFGVGLELLSKWVDFRANGYFPSNSAHTFDRWTTTDFSSKTATYSFSKSRSSTTVRTQNIDGGEGGNDEIINTIRKTTTTTTTTNTHKTKKRVRRTYERQEDAMPGFDLELGGLVPYLDCWAEVRIYGGYSYFQDDFGDDISCFTARLEARPVPAVILGAQYKGDARLLDGVNHWHFGVRVEIPFDLGNLRLGQSPFAGITEAFTPQGECWKTAAVSEQMDKKVVVPVDAMRNRMNEGIIRNWRPTVSRSGFEEVSKRTDVQHADTSTTRTTTRSSVVTQRIILDQPPR